MRKWVEYRPSSNLGLASVRWYTLQRVTSLPGCGYQDNCLSAEHRIFLGLLNVGAFPLSSLGLVRLGWVLC